MLIDQLTKLVPPPPHPLERGQPATWDDVEARLGTPLPDDYKALINTYGTGSFNDFLYVFNPFASNRYRNLFALKDDILSAYAVSQHNFPDDFLDPEFPAAGGLLPWARTDNGDEFYWKTEGSPDTWSIVVIESRNAAQYRYHLTTTDFLVRLLSGTLEPKVFEDVF
jgi:hypothetical protein